jgi:hypothetical protein
VVGVAFFDYKHGHTGVAPNALELHPILDLVCFSQAEGAEWRAECFWLPAVVA